MRDGWLSWNASGFTPSLYLGEGSESVRGLKMVIKGSYDRAPLVNVEKIQPGQ